MSAAAIRRIPDDVRRQLVEQLAALLLEDIKRNPDVLKEPPAEVSR